jgi:hypothetical protein
LIDVTKLPNQIESFVGWSHVGAKNWVFQSTELTGMRLFLSRLAIRFHSITTAALSGDYQDIDGDFFSRLVKSSDREVNRPRALVH